MNIRFTERQQEILAGLSFILLFAIGFGTGEGALRLIQAAKFGTATRVEDSDRFFIDEATKLRLPVPGSVHGRIHYNEFGYRSPQIPATPPPGTLRIAFMGSSTTLDPYAADTETWSHVAVEELKKRFPLCHFDYINAGLPGISTSKTTTYYREFVSRNEPAIVVALLRDINAMGDYVAMKRFGYDGVHYRPGWLARHSVLWSKIEMNVTVIARQRAAFSEGRNRLNDAEEMAATFETPLKGFVQTVRDSGAEMALLTITGQLRHDQLPSQQVAAAVTSLFFMPYMTINGLLDADDRFNDVIRKTGAAMNVPVIDSHMSIPGDEKYFTDSLHFTPMGSQYAGKKIGDSLAELENLRPLFERCSSHRP